MIITSTKRWLRKTSLYLLLGIGAFPAYVFPAFSSDYDLRLFKSLGPAGVLNVSYHPKCIWKNVAKAIETCGGALELAQGKPLSEEQLSILEIVIAYHTGKGEISRAKLQKAIEKFPDSFMVRHLSARHALSDYANYGRHARLPDFEREIAYALKIKPSDVDALGTRAISYNNFGKMHEAETAFNGLLTRAPNNIFALFQRSTIDFYTGRYDRALSSLDKAADLQPEDKKIRTLRARVRLQVGDYAGAVEDYEFSLAGVARNDILIAERASAYLMNGNIDSALQDLNALLETNESRPAGMMLASNRAALLLKRAGILRTKKRYVEAARDVLEAVNLSGKQAVLKIQVYLRRHGFNEVSINGKTSKILDDAIISCFANGECERGMFSSL